LVPPVPSIVMNSLIDTPPLNFNAAPLVTDVPVVKFRPRAELFDTMRLPWPTVVLPS
jgi:hypothetical protein